MTTWIPLMDYAMKKGVSLSTLRRHIKANKVQYRVENGRYLLLDTEISETLAQTKVERLEQDLQKAQEEIAELKMLVAIYEEKMAPQRFDS